VVTEGRKKKGGKGSQRGRGSYSYCGRGEAWGGREEVGLSYKKGERDHSSKENFAKGEGEGEGSQKKRE